MARFGRSFPSHTKITKAGISNYSITVGVACPAVPILLRGPVRILSVASPVGVTLSSLKLKSIQTLSVASATVSTLAHQAGKGVVLSVASPVARSITKQLRKFVNAGNLPSNFVYQTDVISALPDQYWQFRELGDNTNVNYDTMVSYFMSSSGGVTKGVPDIIAGSAGGAVMFDGSSGAGSTGVVLNTFQNHDFSIEYWTYPFSTNSSRFAVSIGTQNNAAQDNFLHVGFISTKQLRFGFFSDDLDSVTLFNPYTLYHIVVTWNVATKQKIIYVNGVQDVSGFSSGALNVPSDASGHIGAVTFANGNGPFYYNGVLGHLAMYSSVLDAATVAKHYSEGVTGVPYVAPVNPGTGAGSSGQAVSPAPAIQKFIGKFLGSAAGQIPRFTTRSRVVMNNFDGGIVVPLSETVLNNSPVVSVIPGLFRISPPKGTLKVQFKAFVLKVVKRVQIT